MRRPELRYLTDEDLNKVHTLALEMLENMGLELKNQEACDYFEKAGAVVEGSIVKIPRKVIEDALKTVPKRDEFVLYGRDPKNDIKVNEALPSLAAMTMATSVIDPYTRKKRPATNQDLDDLTRILETMENVGIASGLITPQDIPLESSDWYTWAGTIKNTTKHITGGAVGKEGVRDAVEMAQLALGSDVKFEDRPFISFWVLTSPPMCLDENPLNVLMEASRLNAPSVISSGGILGISSPMSIEGAVIHTHAENIAAIALTQLVRPGVSVLYSSYVRSMDMQSMSVNMSSPETIIMKSIMAELGKYLDLPTKMPTQLRDSKVLDAQAGFETGMGGTIGALTTDFLVSMQLDIDLVVDYADLPYSNECMGQLRRLVRGLEFNEKRIAMKVMEEVGHGGSYLSAKHTAKNFKKEIWTGKLAERGNWKTWEKAGAKDILEKSSEKAVEILEAVRTIDLLDEETRQKIDAIAEGAFEKSKKIKR